MGDATVLELDWHDELTARQTGDLRELLSAVRDADGRPLVEDRGPLPADLRAGSLLLATGEAGLLGYAHLDTRGDAFGRKVAELAVHPEHRDRGIGTALVGEVLAAVGITPGSPETATPADGHRLAVWSHGDHPAAAKVAARHGLDRVRELYRMRLRTADADLGEPVLPEGMRLRTFEPGTDENAVVAVNRAAFDWHPEQSALTVGDLIRAENEEWFDPAGFFVAERTDGSGGIAGFHWTKVHQRVVADDSGLPTGEVYVVGVAPEAQGTGLGRALTVAGLAHLRDAGLRQQMLYVESDNTAAIRLYERIGFTHWDTDVQYSK